MQRKLKEEKITPIKLVKDTDGGYKIANANIAVTRACKHCCCAAHCGQNFHNSNGSVIGVCLSTRIDTVVKMESYEFPHVYEADMMGTEVELEPVHSNLMVDRKDEIYDVLTALQTKFDLV